MDIWHYHPESGVLLGHSHADPSPLKPSEYLIPAFATTIAPPSIGAGKRAVWSVDAWLVEDIPAPLPNPEPTDPEPSAPRWVSMRQARLALLQQGLLASVETAIAAAGQAAQIEWEYAHGVEMDSPLVEAMRDALGLTDDDVLGLFAIAGGL